MNLTVFRAWLQARLGIKDERGANLVEYVLLLAFIAIVVIVGVQFLGKSVSHKFSQASTNLG